MNDVNNGRYEFYCGEHDRGWNSTDDTNFCPKCHPEWKEQTGFQCTDCKEVFNTLDYTELEDGSFLCGDCFDNFINEVNEINEA